MKKMKSLQIIFKFLLILMVPVSGCISAQNMQKTTKEGDSTVQNLVKSQNYVFKARSVLPMRGGMKMLTTDYDLVVSKDTIQAWLPYFGRAYRAPIDPTEGGIKFTSTEFSYKINNRKKGGWRVKIKPKDVRNIRKLTLTISESGYASLHVMSNYRQPISFHGKVIEK